MQRRLDASDLTQDTLLAATRGSEGKSFAGRGALRAWLRVILRNIAAQHARRRGFHAVHDELSSSLPCPAGAHVGDVGDRESHEEIQRRLQHLSERNRTVVMLRIAENLPFRAIGERMGMSEENARVVFNRVVKDLRRREDGNGAASGTD
jgi:RNA polymerase sigma-70 factor (ECF subfamily)